jgi:hypothetical protein
MCVAVPASSVSAEVPELGSCPVNAGISLGDTGTDVFCLQFALALMGRLQGPLTYVFDQPTADALAWYQSDHPPLAISRQADEPTLQAMGVFSGVDLGPAAPTCQADAPLKRGTRGPSVQCVQKRLSDLGYYAGSQDGVFGDAVAFALQQFQLAQPAMDPTGVADTRTLAAMGVWSGFSIGDTDIGSSGRAAPPGPWPAPAQPEPNWQVNALGIPFYASRNACSRADADVIASQFANDGASIDVQQWAVYIASREGNCNYRAVNINPATQDDSHCTFQLNALAGMFRPNGELGRRGWTIDNVKESMKNCADAASDLWVYCGKGPWTPPYACTPPWQGDLGAGGDA